MFYRIKLEQMIYELKKENYKMQEELSEIGPGYIMSVKRGNSIFYYRRIPKNGNHKKEKRFGITNNEDEISRLLRKSYLTRSIREHDHDISVLQTALDDYHDLDKEAIQNQDRKRFPELAPDLFNRRKSAADKWMAEFVQDTSFHPEQLNIVTSGGLRVRSKSELAIVGRLEHFKIAYRYECPLVLRSDGIKGRSSSRYSSASSSDYPGSKNAADTEVLLPDFTIMRASDNKIFYWEHCGLMDDPYYVRNFKRKRWLYEKNGINMWDNLIITFDEADGGINEMEIDAKILGRLI